MPKEILGQGVERLWGRVLILELRTRQKTKSTGGLLPCPGALPCWVASAMTELKTWYILCGFVLACQFPVHRQNPMRTTNKRLGFSEGK